MIILDGAEPTIAIYADEFVWFQYHSSTEDISFKFTPQDATLLSILLAEKASQIILKEEIDQKNA
jgi:hypothetical protein